MVGCGRPYVRPVGAIASSSTATEAILFILEIVVFSTSQPALFSVTATAAALELVSLGCITYYTITESRRLRRFGDAPERWEHFFLCSSILVSVAALIVSLVSIVLKKTTSQDTIISSSPGQGLQWLNLISGQIAVWVISSVSQVFLYSMSVRCRKATETRPVTSSGPRDSVMSESRPSRPNDLYLMESSRSVAVLGALPSPTFSTRSSHSLGSFRESLRHVVRPVTSHTTLISRPSFTRDSHSVHSDFQSFEDIPRSDGFDSWDTSSVSLPVRDAVMQTAPSRGTTLEPIPGSRPASPARVLDGPFLSEFLEEDAGRLTPPPPRMVRDVSRPPSPVVSEAHIHPLFRTESPTPPLATPGTSILASPLANQAIACPARPFNRIRCNSRAASPSPLSHAKSFTRDRALSMPSRSRSSSPPSREMTPPIPDFILNASPRSSMSGSRKVNLHPWEK
ncbi:hypothetical protein ACN47E_007059 [Coniothyrium glycines]